MTKKEALTTLNLMKCNAELDKKRILLACNIAMEAIRKQIPWKPDLEGDGYDDKGELIYDTGYCPDCCHEFEVYYDAPKYCPDCGKALNWEGVENDS